MAARIANEEVLIVRIVLCFMVTMSNKFYARQIKLLQAPQVIAVRCHPRRVAARARVAVQEHLCTSAREIVHATA
jgi:hypothetical protein